MSPTGLAWVQRFVSAARSHAVVALGIAAGLIVVTVILLGGSTPSASDLVNSVVTADASEERVEAAAALAELFDPGAVAKLANRADDTQRAARGLVAVRDHLIDLYGVKATTADQRVDIVRTLGAVDDADAASVVTGALVNDQSAKVRRAAARSIASMSDSAPGVYTQIVHSRFDSNAEEIDLALTLVGPPVLPELLVQRESDWAADVAAQIAADDLDLLVRLLGSDGIDTDGGIARTLVVIERTRPDEVAAVWPEVIDVLIDRLGAFDTMDGAEVALAEIGEPAVAPLIEVARRRHPEFVGNDPQAQQEESNRIFSASDALIRVGQRDVALIQPLIDILDRRDLEAVADMSEFYLMLGKPGSESVLVDALARLPYLGDDRSSVIFFQFFDSANSVLVAGARTWASSQGLTITGSAGGGTNLTWGSSGIYE